MNSGEGGLLTTNDPDIAARAVVSSGSYMLYGRHGAIPANEAFENTRLYAPGSGRMDHVEGGDAAGTIAKTRDQHCPLEPAL